MSIIIGILEEGLIYAILALGFISLIKFWIFRIFRWTVHFR